MDQWPIDLLRDAIETHTGHRGRQHGGQWQLHCPAHPDRSPSLSLGENTDHHALLYCHTGCASDDILASLGKTRRDLYPVRPDDRRTDPVVATYRYVDIDGQLLYEVERTVSKRFRQRRPDPARPGTWIYNLEGVQRVLYRLPALQQAIRDGQTIYLVEGEKDVHTAERLGQVATCNPGGAGKWRPEYTDTLRGAHLVIIADNDPTGTGLAHAQKVAHAVAPVAASLIVGIPTVGKDLTDLTTAGFGVDDIQIVTLSGVQTEPTSTERATPTDTRTDAREPDDGQEKAIDDMVGRRLRVTPASAFRPAATRWVWATPDNHSGWLALGELTLIAGREGVGKSTFLAWLAGQITRGSLPGIYEGTPRTVLYAASEDSWAYTIVPRMIAAGADLDRVLRIDVEDEGLPMGLSLPRDSRALPALAREYDAAVLMCDPILSLVDGQINPNHSKELRTALEPLRAAAEDAGLAIPALAHFNKTRDVDGLTMIAGSRAWSEVARTAILLAWDNQAGQVVVSQAKNNVGRRQEHNPTYRIVDTVIEADDGGEIHIGRVQWGQDSSITAEAVLQRVPERGGSTDNEQAVLSHLSDAAGRPRSPHQIAEATGVNHATIRSLLRRMAAAGSVVVARTGEYRLPLTNTTPCAGCGQPMIPVDGSTTHPTCGSRRT